MENVIKKIHEYSLEEIMEERKRLGLPVTRTKASYVSEWKSHNRLYKIILLQSFKDCFIVIH